MDVERFESSSLRRALPGGRGRGSSGGRAYVGRSSFLSSRIWLNPVMENASVWGLTLAKCRGDLLQWNLTEPCEDKRGRVQPDVQLVLLFTLSA